ncbi:MAG: sugar ABC transporter substrate-binding protein [Acetobacteraceae bacterium]
MRTKVLALCLAAALTAAWALSARAAEPPLRVIFTTHSSPSNPFWQSVKNGFDDACHRVEAECQLLFTQTEGSIPDEIANIEAAIARHPNVLLTTLPDNNAFVGVLKEAKAKHIIVIADNVDATAGPELALRASFIGQNFIPAGYNLAQYVATEFPKTGPIKILIGVSAPGQNWSEQRAEGIQKYLAEYKKAHPDQSVTWKRMDSGTDLAVTAARVGAYLNAHPDTTAYFDTGLWEAGVAQSLKNHGVKPGKILLGGFDLVPAVLTMMKAGYIQAAVDQQPYTQGFLGVMQAYLMTRFKLGAWSVNTGDNLVTPANVDAVIALSKEHLR